MTGMRKMFGFKRISTHNLLPSEENNQKQQQQQPKYIVQINIFQSHKNDYPSTWILVIKIDVFLRPTIGYTGSSKLKSRVLNNHFGDCNIR